MNQNYNMPFMPNNIVFDDMDRVRFGRFGGFRPGGYGGFGRPWGYGGGFIAPILLGTAFGAATAYPYYAYPYYYRYPYYY